MTRDESRRKRLEQLRRNGHKPSRENDNRYSRRCRTDKVTRYRYSDKRRRHRVDSGYEHRHGKGNAREKIVPYKSRANRGDK